MGIREFQDSVRRMSPLKRLFTSAALAIPVEVASIAAYLVAGPGAGGLIGLGLGLAGVLFVQSYADHRLGAYNVFGMPLSKDGIHNVGAYIASSMFVAPAVVGTALSLVFGAFSSAHAAELDANRFAAEEPETETAEMVEAQSPLAGKTFDYAPA